jgi:hypothetical protein
VRHSLAAARRAITAFGSETTIVRGAAIWVSPIVRNFARSNMESTRTVTITAAAALSQIQQLAGQLPASRQARLFLRNFWTSPQGTAKNAVPC